MGWREVGVEEVAEAVEKACGGDAGRLVEALPRRIPVPSTRLLREGARLFAAFSNPVRLGILALLLHGDMPVCAISRLLGVEKSLVSHNLKLLRDLGLVSRRVVGRYRVYTLREKELVKKLLEVVLGSPR